MNTFRHVFQLGMGPGGGPTEVLPFLQSTDDCQYLLVVDLVVPLDRGQGLGEEGDWVPLFVFCRYLREDSTSHEVGTVGFDAEGPGQVRGDQDWRGSDTLLQPIKGRLFHAFPVPSSIVLD